MSSDTTDLKVSLQEQPSWSRRLNITVPAERVQRIRSSVSSQITRNARMPGFRKGKLPQRVLEQRFGPSIEQETLDRTIQEAFREALQAQGLAPISQGKVDNIQYEKGQDLTFEVEFEVRPEIQLERVSGFTVSRPASEVGEDDVESILERLRDDRATWEALAEDARPGYGDQVTVEITAKDAEGNPVEGEEARTYRFALGEGQAIPDVEQAIMTLQTGQEGDFTVKFPDDFPEEERRGEEQHLHIVLKTAQSKQLPEVDDEFAQAMGEFESLEALRTRILEDLRNDAEQRAEAEVRGQLVEQIVEANPFEVPASMVERYLDYMTGHSHADGEEHNHTPEEEERIRQQREQLRPQAEWGMKRMMLVERIAEQEGLSATQDEIDARVEELAAKHERTPSEVWLQLEKSGQLEVLEREITEDKVFRFLLEQNTVA